MFQHIRKDRFAARWKHSAGKFYSTTHVAPSDYHLFETMGHALAEQRFSSHEDKNWLDEWFAAKGEDFFTGLVFINFTKYGVMNTFNKALFIILPNFTCLLKSEF